MKDWNDAHRAGFNARAVADKVWSEESKANGKGPPSGDALICRCASEIAPERVDWLWPGRIARGKHTCFAGEPGTGKSQLATDIEARITMGAEWPCGEGRAPQGSIIILSAEDGEADTIVPRLLAAGADLGRVHIISAVRIEDKGRRSFNLRADLDLLERKIVELGDVGLIRIDPISSYLGKTDSHNNAEVRGVLEPIAEMAERMRIAILSITHFSKTGAATTTKALHRFIGSIAFVGAPRAAFAVIEDSSDTERRLLLHAKNNLAAPPQGLAFRLKQTIVGDLGKGIVASRVEWEQEPVTVTADEALAAEAAGAADTSSGVEAENFLQELLAEGPVPAKQVRADVEAAALSWSTVKRAKARLGIKAEKDGMDGGWSWSLPRRGSNLSEEDHVLNVSPFVPDEPLRQDAISDELPDLPAFLDRRVRT